MAYELACPGCGADAVVQSTQTGYLHFGCGTCGGKDFFSNEEDGTASDQLQAYLEHLGEHVDA